MVVAHNSLVEMWTRRQDIVFFFLLPDEKDCIKTQSWCFKSQGNFLWPFTFILAEPSSVSRIEQTVCADTLSRASFGNQHRDEKTGAPCLSAMTLCVQRSNIPWQTPILSAAETDREKTSFYSGYLTNPSRGQQSYLSFWVIQAAQSNIHCY